MVFDILFLIGCFLCIYNLRIYLGEVFDSLPQYRHNDFKSFLFLIVIIFVLLYYEGIYHHRFDFWQDVKKIFIALFFAYLIVLSIMTITKTSLEYSRLLISIYFFALFVFFPIYKRVYKKVLYKFGYFKQKILIVATKDEIIRLKKEYKLNWYLGLEYSKREYESIIIISKNQQLDDINHYISHYLATNPQIYLVPYITNINFSDAEILEYTNLRYSAITIENRLLNKKNKLIKRVFDIFATFMILPFFIIIHIIISTLIKLDSNGSVLFRQKRLGKNDKDFYCFKYRTMYENSDNILKEYLAQNPDEIEYYQIYHKYKNDPRITKIGRFLRNTSLDELPQILNVLRGEMSLIGPRPYMINEREKLKENKDIILRATPGITGLWQVSGRNNLTFKQRNELESYYIHNWSIWQDIVILVKTIKVVLFKIGAR